MLGLTRAPQSRQLGRVPTVTPADLAASGLGPPAPKPKRPPGRPFTSQTAKAARALSYAPTSARGKPKPQKPPRKPLAPAIAPSEEVAILTEQVRLCDKRLRRQMPAVAAADLGRTLVSLLNALNKAKGVAKKDHKAERSEPGAGLLDLGSDPAAVVVSHYEHWGNAEGGPGISPVNASGEPGVRGPTTESKPDVMAPADCAIVPVAHTTGSVPELNDPVTHHKAL